VSGGVTAQGASSVIAATLSARDDNGRGTTFPGAKIKSAQPSVISRQRLLLHTINALNQFHLRS